MFLDILLDSLKDSLLVLPILLLVYFLIELLEYKQAKKFQNIKFLSSKNSPIFGALFGSLPQCGFSVVATDLYTKRKINVGALIAVYIATSDEAIPVMLSNITSGNMFLPVMKMLLPLLLIKIVLGIVVGVLAQIVFDRIFIKSKTTLPTENVIINTKDNHDEHNGDNHEEHKHEHEHEEKIEVHHHGCCKHDIETKKYDWKHPILHSIKIFITILIINIILGVIIQYGFKGEENLADFLSNSSVFALQPILALLVGFIPNCASSVVLTELYLAGGLSFGSIVCGLTVNAGLGLILLLKKNKNIKENIFIITVLTITSLTIGYILHFII